MTSPTMHWAVTVPTRSEQRVSLRGPSASEPQQRKGRGDCADWRGDCGPSRDAARPGEAGPRSVGPRSADAFCSHCSTARRLHLSLYPSPGSTHENSSSPVGRRCRATALPSARGCQRQTDSRTDGPIWTQRRTRQRESTMRATYTGRAICVRKVMQSFQDCWHTPQSGPAGDRLPSDTRSGGEARAAQEEVALPAVEYATTAFSQAMPRGSARRAAEASLAQGGTLSTPATGRARPNAPVRSRSAGHTPRTRSRLSFCATSEGGSFLVGPGRDRPKPTRKPARGMGWAPR